MYCTIKTNIISCSLDIVSPSPPSSPTLQHTSANTIPNNWLSSFQYQAHSVIYSISMSFAILFFSFSFFPFGLPNLKLENRSQISPCRKDRVMQRYLSTIKRINSSILALGMSLVKRFGSLSVSFVPSWSAKASRPKLWSQGLTFFSKVDHFCEDKMPGLFNDRQSNRFPCVALSVGERKKEKVETSFEWLWSFPYQWQWDHFLDVNAGRQTGGNPSSSWKIRFWAWNVSAFQRLWRFSSKYVAQSSACVTGFHWCKSLCRESSWWNCLIIFWNSKNKWVGEFVNLTTWTRDGHWLPHRQTTHCWRTGGWLSGYHSPALLRERVWWGSGGFFHGLVFWKHFLQRVCGWWVGGVNMLN